MFTVLSGQDLDFPAPVLEVLLELRHALAQRRHCRAVANIQIDQWRVAHVRQPGSRHGVRQGDQGQILQRHLAQVDL